MLLAGLGVQGNAHAGEAVQHRSGSEEMLVDAKLSKADQETAVGQGLALGCVALEGESFNTAKMTVELAFVHAWRSWSSRSHFPAVRAKLSRNDLLRIISKSPRRRSTHLTGWSNEWPFVPFISEHWSIKDVAELLEGQTKVPSPGGSTWLKSSLIGSPRLPTAAATERALAARLGAVPVAELPAVHRWTPRGPR